MALDLTQLFFFLALSLGASTVNGALGYGFSSISIPLAILFFSNKVLNPAYVLAELPLNFAILILERHHLRATFSKAFPIVISLLPGVLLGAYLLSSLSSIWVRMAVYLVLLPLVLLQAGGIRRPISSEFAAKIPFGAAVGTMYSLTTISGPPLALFWRNQGLAKNEFRAALAQIRIAEGLFTAVTYYFIQLYTPASNQIALVVFLPIILGVPIGRLIIRNLRVETFRRMCMSFDAWIIGYGVARTIIDLKLASVPVAYLVWAAVVAADSWLLYRFFYWQARGFSYRIGTRPLERLNSQPG